MKPDQMIDPQAAAQRAQDEAARNGTTAGDVLSAVGDGIFTAMDIVGTVGSFAGDCVCAVGSAVGEILGSLG